MTMEDSIDSLMKMEFVSVWVRDPRQHKDFWHTHVDYEICLHTNSMCFTKKISCVRRRYSEFVWLRQQLANNSPVTDLPKLPSSNPFFNMKNPEHVRQRMRGLQEFLEVVLQMPLVLSDSRLHLFLQSQLSVAKVEACALGKTRYSVDHAILHCTEPRAPRFPDHHDLPPCFPDNDHRGRFPEESMLRRDSDCDSTTSSGLGQSVDGQHSVDGSLTD